MASRRGVLLPLLQPFRVGGGWRELGAMAAANKGRTTSVIRRVQVTTGMDACIFWATMSCEPATNSTT